VEFYLLTIPIKFIGDHKGRVKAMECLKMELGEPDESGRKRPVPLEGSNFELETDLVVIAVGAGANPLITSTTPGLEVNDWGYIVAEPETGKTKKRRVWAGGDIVSGQATVILAMGAGRIAANSIHQYLTWGW
jgi:glutamate synthase (NADPH/NADH) small chain